jgi:hypothetical protein
MISLEYDGPTGRLCGELANEIVQQVQQHSEEFSRPSSFRFHLATSLAGAVLILSTLLCRPLEDVGLEDQHHRYVESFHQGVSMLHNLAQSLQAARRVEEDLKDVTQVVSTLLTQQQSAPQEPLVSLVPPNIEFPYGANDFQSPLLMDQIDELTDSTIASQMNLFSPSTAQTPNPWYTEFQSYGVPWI